MNFDNMPAGPEIDRMVAEQVMGWKCHDRRDRVDARTNSGAMFRIAWSPSTGIAQAWEVLEKLKEQRVYLDIISVDDGWMVGDGGRGFFDEDGRVDIELESHATAPTAPLAICRAALKATAAK